jgi:hypothetical protein
MLGLQGAAVERPDDRISGMETSKRVRALTSEGQPIWKYI